ncbi:MAG: GPW/gp25 family protein, partial [Verrucomicrobiae bacterium]|nr:GPW/gp25 family protein [Verrucomicrobiae bacterium]
PYLAFPFRITNGSPALADRSAHVRGRIEQVLFTLPGERVFRPEFGAGVKALVFEPNDTPLWQITKRRLLASLAQALQGDVEPKSIEVEITGEDAGLTIRIGYTLAAVGHRDTQLFQLGGS